MARGGITGRKSRTPLKVERAPHDIISVRDQLLESAAAIPGSGYPTSASPNPLAPKPNQLRAIAARAEACDDRGRQNDVPLEAPGRGAPRSARGPPVPRGAYSIAEFCTAHGISQAMYFKEKAAGRGPVEMKIGSRRLISFEAAAAWRREREAASDQSAA